MTVFWLFRRVVLSQFTDVLGVPAASVIRVITLIMEAARTNETAAYFYQTTRRNNPEDSHPHARRRENLKSHSAYSLFHNV
jgi:hypothetical protein